MTNNSNESVFGRDGKSVAQLARDLQDHFVDRISDSSDLSFLERSERLDRRRARRKRATWLVMAGAAATSIVVWILVGKISRGAELDVADSVDRNKPLVFMVGDGDVETTGNVGAWYSAKSVLTFRDRSRITLQDEPVGIRVAESTTMSVRVVMDIGTASYSVTPGRDGLWKVDAGPYQVRVIGTEFDVSWSPITGAFSVMVREGRVNVRGPNIADGTVLQSGQSYLNDVAQLLALNRSKTSVAPRLAEGPGGGSAGRPLGAVVSSRGAEKPIRDKPAATVASRVASRVADDHAPVHDEAYKVPAPDWRALAKQGAYRAAMKAVGPQFLKFVNELSADELNWLADVARYAGENSFATAAYLATRKRFVGTPGASRAAFELGRLSFTGDKREAAEWFARYLREAPQGRFVREALGRQLEAEVAASLRPPVALAKRYLKRYPRGPYASLAETTISGAHSMQSKTSSKP